MEAGYLSWVWLLPEWHLLPHTVQVALQRWSLPEVGLLESSHTTQCQQYYTLENPLPKGALGLNAFNHPWLYQISYVFPPPALVSLVMCKLLAEHVIDPFRLLILVAPCWMEAPWLPTILNMLEDIPQHCPIVKYLIVDVSVGEVLRVCNICI